MARPDEFSTLLGPGRFRPRQHPGRRRRAKPVARSNQRRIAVGGEGDGVPEPAGPGPARTGELFALLDQRIDPQWVRGARVGDANQHLPVAQLQPGSEHAPAGIRGVKVAVTKRGVPAAEQHRAVAHPGGEVAGEIQRDRQRSRAGSGASRDVEALLDSQRAVRVPLRERAARVADAVRVGTRHGRDDRLGGARVSEGGEPHAEPGRARGNRNSTAREAGAQVLCRVDDPEAGDPVGGFAPPRATETGPRAASGRLVRP